MDNDIKNCIDTNELDILVNETLTQYGELENSISEPYHETAKRVEETLPELSSFMTDAEKRWHQIESGD